MTPKIPILVAAYLAVAATAQAELVTLRAADFGLGTNVTEALAGTGATLHTLTRTLDGASAQIVAVDVITDLAWHAPRDTIGFNWTLETNDYERCRANPSAWTCADFRAGLEIAFDTPTDSVSILGWTASDPVTLEFYGVTGEHLGTCTSGGGPTSGTPGSGCYSVTTFDGNRQILLSFQSDSARIGRVVYGGVAGRATAVEITYGVPEPGTLALCLLGACGWSVPHLRRRKSRPGP